MSLRANVGRLKGTSARRREEEERRKKTGDEVDGRQNRPSRADPCAVQSGTDACEKPGFSAARPRTVNDHECACNALQGQGGAAGGGKRREKERTRKRAAHAVAIIVSYPGTGIKISLPILPVLRLMKVVRTTVKIAGSLPLAGRRLQGEGCGLRRRCAVDPAAQLPALGSCIEFSRW